MQRGMMFSNPSETLGLSLLGGSGVLLRMLATRAVEFVEVKGRFPVDASSARLRRTLHGVLSASLHSSALNESLLAPITMRPRTSRIVTLVGESCYLGKEMRCNQFEEFAGGDDFGPFPVSRKVPYIPSDQIIGIGNIGALDELIVSRIDCDLEMSHGSNQVGRLLDDL
jgi:hypothetical protein